MNKSQIRILMCVLCLMAVYAIIAGCQSQAAGQDPAKDTKAEAKKAEAKKAEAKGPTLGPYKLAMNWMDEPGFVDHWLVIGPFPNPGERPDNAGFNIDYLKNYGGETDYVPTNGLEVKDANGNTFKWQQYEGTTTDISFFAIEGLGLEPQQEDILCYVACWLDSDADKDVELRVGSDDGYKLWLNHKLVGEQNVYRSMEMDQETYKVKLNKGMNLVLMKVTQDWGEYEFMFRVVNSEGKEVPGITVWN